MFGIWRPPCSSVVAPDWMFYLDDFGSITPCLLVLESMFSKPPEKVVLMLSHTRDLLVFACSMAFEIASVWESIETDAEGLTPASTRVKSSTFRPARGSVAASAAPTAGDARCRRFVRDVTGGWSRVPARSNCFCQFILFDF